MELRLPQRFLVPFFWPINSTTVRSLKQTTRLAAVRARFRLLGAISPNRAVTEAVRLFMTPPRQAFSDAELAILEEASLLPVPLVTGRLVGWRWGKPSAPCVVLVHGWGGRGVQLHPFVEPLLARGFSVVAFDAPGHGMSGDGESSMVHFIAALKAVLAKLGPVHAVLGHSMGGAATACVLAAGAEASRVVLVAPPASVTEASRRFAATVGLPEVLRVEMQRKIQHRFGIGWDEFEPERSAGRQALLVIHDEGDREVPLRQGQRYIAAWPGARLLRTTGLGHRRLLADPGVIAAAVDFIAVPLP